MTKITNKIYLGNTPAKVYSNSKLGRLAKNLAKVFGTAVVKIKVEVNGKEKIVSIKKSDLNKAFHSSICHDHPWMNAKKIVYNYKLSFNSNVKAAELNVYKEISHDLQEPINENSIETIVNNVKTNPESIAHINRWLSEIHQNRSISKNTKAFAGEISKGILSLYSEKMKQLPPSNDKREGSIRAPTEVLVDLLAYLKDKGNKEVEAEAKSLFLQHNATIENVQSFLGSVEERFPDLANKCQNLKNELMKQPIYTRLHENIYGRVFDSAFAQELVNNPPPEVSKAMTQISFAFADYLEGLNLSGSNKKAIEKDLINMLTKEDPRFWFPATPELEQLPYEKDVLGALIQYLRTEKKTGHECISVPYVVSKMNFFILRKNWVYPLSLFFTADLNYWFSLQPYVKNVRVDRQGPPLKTEGGGITLHYQPSVAKEKGMVPSQRPSNVRKPNLDWTQLSVKEKKALQKHLEHGLPWGSGISGTTNICMYAMNYLNKTHPIDMKPAVLGLLMFLVYDGGHSIHEMLWALGQIDKKLDLNLGIDTPPKLGDFIADYEKFTDIYQGDLKSQINSAFVKSFDEVIKYYKEHSYYESNISKD